MRIYFYWILFFTQISIVFAQQEDERVLNYSDSLERKVQMAANDSVRIERLLDLSFFWSDRDTTKAFQYLDKVREITGPRPNDYHKGLLLHFTANIIYGHDMIRAKEMYLHADHYLSKSSFPRAYHYRAKAWSNYGTLLQAQDSSSKFMEIIIEKAIPFARLAGDSLAVGNHLQNIGLLLSNIQDHSRALSYFEMAINTLSKYADAHEEKLTVYVNAAKNVILGGMTAKARVFLDQAEKELNRIPHSQYAPYYYRTEGIYYRALKENEKSLESFQRGIEAAKYLADEYSLRDINFEIYALYRDANDYANAKRYLVLADSYMPNTSVYNILLHRREMANTEYKLGNFELAFVLMKAYAEGKDTLDAKTTELKIVDLENKYQSIEKENEILKLEDTNRKQQLSIGRNNLWIALLIVVLFVALVITYLLWRLAKGNREALSQQRKLHQEELINLKQQEQLLQYDSILQIQEQERNRISRDLHDGLGGLLAGIKLRLSTTAYKKQAKAEATHPVIESVIDELDHAVDELRRIARNLMPESLLMMGLKPALSDLCNYMETDSISVKFQGYELHSHYSHSMLIGVYRIIQELLNNALKHAKASQIIVQCSESDQHLFITVEDDGIGLDLASTTFGMGIHNIKNRVALLQGIVDIDSKLGHGTTVHIELPILI